MFSENLKFALQNKEITQTRLAQELGISQQAINRWCHGITQPDNDTIVKIAQYLDVSTDFLLGNEKKRSEYEQELYEIQTLRQLLIKNGYMKAGEDLSDNELKNLIEFVKTNKKYIKESK